MKPHDDDPDEAALQRLFSARESRDEAAAPGFERVVQRPSPRRRRTADPGCRGRAPGGDRRRGIVWKLHSGPAPSRPPRSPEGPTLASWKAPTDFLLTVPGGELIDSTPAFPDPTFSIQGDSE